IYLDVSAAVHHRAGLGRYAESLTRALLELPQEEFDFALFYNQEQGIQPLEGLENLPSRTVSLGYKPWRMLIWLGQLGHIPFNRLIPNATLFHAMEHLLLPLNKTPTTLTVHDLIFRHLPQHHKPLNRWYLNATLPLYCKRASHIIAVSEATRQDIIHSYDIPEEKISVIYEAADPKFQPQSQKKVNDVRNRYHLPQDFLLYLGTIEPRKNLIRLLKAWEPLYQANEAPPLVLGGKRGWLSDDFFAALEQSPARDGVLLTGYVADEDLPALYAAATAFIYPSLYEGFGLPPLEAMACGTPVVCSNASSLPEVVGTAALTCEPENEEAIREEIRRIIQDEELRVNLREQGLKQAAKFSWARAAQETLTVYKKALV
ncbi:MAG: glycosyltransferase family 4 protein, partial [Anaerolineae bacterium]|nr:glycosyltransferase family 4 protein [Anaerolineae bacterium]